MNDTALSKNATVYVAGHKGLVGHAMVERLSAAGYSAVVTRTSRELDLRRQDQTEEFFSDTQPEVVVLAAAKVGGIHANNTYKAEFIYDNITIATNVIEAARRHGVRKLVNLGSSCIYPRLAPQPMSEESLLSGLLEQTNEPYAIAKIAAIKLCRYYNEQYGTNFISAMPTNLYGPNDNFDLETSHVLPALIRRIHEAKATGVTEVTLWGDGTPRREFLHVRDLADALVFLIENVDARDFREQRLDDYFVNVGFGKDVSIAELAETIAEVVGYQGTFRWDTTKPNGTPQKLLDISRMSRLGWSPTLPLREGIEDTYAWYRENEGELRGR